VTDVVDKLCAPLQWERELDMVTLVQSVPLLIISRLLGLDEASSDAELFLRAAPAYFRGINPLADESARDEAELAANQMFEVLSRTVESRRRDPQTDMVTQTLEMAAGMGGVTTEDVVRALVILVAAGTDTTRLTTSLAVRTLLANPTAFEALKANRDDVKNAVMELLRYDSPTKPSRTSRGRTRRSRAARSSCSRSWGPAGIRAPSRTRSVSTSTAISAAASTSASARATAWACTSRDSRSGRS
jgi:cytochrome P450